MTVAVVILNYNGKHFLSKFLPSVVSYSVGHKVIIADNGSDDGSVELIESDFPDVILIRINENKGYTGGYNEALKQVHADVYVLVNTDIEVTEGWIDPIVELMSNDNSIAACQPKLLSYNNKNIFEYAGAAGGYIDFLGFPFCRGRLFQAMEDDSGQYNDIKQVFWASGACFFIRSDVFHRLGGFDEDFFAHMEEVDLCWRFKNSGYKIMSVPESEVYHVGGSIISYGSAPKTYRNYRNSLILLMKNLPLDQLIWKFPYRLFLDGIAFFHLLFRGDVLLAFTIIKSHWHFHVKTLYWLRKRAEVQKLSKKGTEATYYPQSIVWKYFINRVRKFSDLNWKY